jgi:hypothetical protein
MKIENAAHGNGTAFNRMSWSHQTTDLVDNRLAEMINGPRDGVDLRYIPPRAEERKESYCRLVSPEDVLILSTSKY